MEMYEIITQFAVGEKSKVNAFEELRQKVITSGISSKEELNNALYPGEVRFMEEFYTNDPDAVTKGGKWKFRTYLPKAYTSSKNVLGNALDAGVNVSGKGKTAIEKETKESKSVPKSTFEKAQECVYKLYKLCNELNEEDVAAIRDELRWLVE